MNLKKEAEEFMEKTIERSTVREYTLALISGGLDGWRDLRPGELIQFGVAAALLEKDLFGNKENLTVENIRSKMKELGWHPRV